MWVMKRIRRFWFVLQDIYLLAFSSSQTVLIGQNFLRRYKGLRKGYNRMELAKWECPETCLWTSPLSIYIQRAVKNITIWRLTQTELPSNKLSCEFIYIDPFIFTWTPMSAKSQELADHRRPTFKLKYVVIDIDKLLSYFENLVF